jgi:hypothetical protein
LLNLREAAAEAFLGRDPADFENDNADLQEDGTADAGGKRQGNGWRRLLRELSEAFPQGVLRELPEKFDAFFEHARIRAVGHPEARLTFVRQLERAKKELEEADSATTISPSIMGYFALKLSGLSETERRTILQQVGRRYNFPEIKVQLLDLFPRGSVSSRGDQRGGGGGRRWALPAVGEAFPQDQLEDVYEGDWRQEGAWQESEWQEGYAAYPAHHEQSVSASQAEDLMAEAYAMGSHEAWSDGSTWAGGSDAGWSDADWSSHAGATEALGEDEQGYAVEALEAEAGHEESAEASDYRQALVGMREARIEAARAAARASLPEEASLARTSPRLLQDFLLVCALRRLT